MKSFISVLKEECNELVISVKEFLLNLDIGYEESCILKINDTQIDRGNYYYIVGRTPLQEKNQILLLNKYNNFIVKVDRLVEKDNIPSKIKGKYLAIKQKFRKWIDLEDITFLKDKINIPDLEKDEKELMSILDLFTNEGEEVILIPDTNALLIEPDPNKYKELVDEDIFTFLLLPTVISELDKLKENTTDSMRKDKAKKIIKRIKGWKTQGKITKGITLNKTITLKAEVGEPLENNLPEWLNLSNNDDKILAYILNIQKNLPSSVIILITRDINMQNKAETLNIEYKDIDLKENK